MATMLENVCKTYDDQGFFVIDRETGSGVLDHLRKIKSGDIVLTRLDKELSKELYLMRTSPHVAIFTSIPPVGSYTTSPFEIVAYQTYNNYIIGSDETIDATHALKVQPKAKMLRTRTSLLPADWEIAGRGEHDRENAALAYQAAQLFKVTNDQAREILESWKPLRGRLESVKKIKGIEFYNDSASISAYSTALALQNISKSRNGVLIFGGAEAGWDYGGLYRLLPEHIHTLILIPGSGTVKQRNRLRELEEVKVLSAPSIEEAVRLSLENSEKGDVVLFSPGFEAAGIDRTRAERGDRFVRAIRAL
jgi:UDP-N-acetylmuramoylalanine-D-glutamate ligase